MSTPIEALAQEYALKNKPAGAIIHEPKETVAYQAFMAGAKAASGQGEARIKELEEALRFYAAEWGSAVNDELIMQGGFFPYDANDYDQVKDGGKIARQALSGAGKGEAHE